MPPDQDSENRGGELVVMTYTMKTREAIFFGDFERDFLVELWNSPHLHPTHFFLLLEERWTSSIGAEDRHNCI